MRAFRYFLRQLLKRPERGRLGDDLRQYPAGDAPEVRPVVYGRERS